MIFIHVIFGHSVRQTAERYQHSYSTISSVIHEVSVVMMRVRNKLFVKPSSTIIPERISSTHKFSPFFEHCIGALDGSHIPAVLPAADKACFRNRKGVLSKNVLAVVNFDMTFSYVLAGWEGCAHDGRLLSDALRKNLTIFQGKYYLGDAGYALKRYCLTPYRGIRYHLKEWERNI